MEIIATQKYLILSPRKIRPVADVVRKMTPAEALERLPFVGKKAAEPLAKVIRQAMANARNRGFSESDLTFKEIQIGEGPRLKRGRPVSRGQWHPIKKRMSHIRVVLETKTEEKPKGKEEIKAEPKKAAVKGGKVRGTKN